MNETAPVARATILYESMFGNTRKVAEAIAEGLRPVASVTLLPVKDAPEAIDADLLIVGAPTHVHGLSRPATRTQAGAWADDEARHLTLEPDAEGIGLREWLETCGRVPPQFAAFDTRADMTELFSGSAASVIDKRMRKLGSRRFVQKQSFLVDKDSVLEDGQLERAREWGRTLAGELRMPALR
ncbi:flavodoxin family protein [Leifsonia poae]|uniref:flavodoxin family protein n=1 Tax=Leifsonia poae TaxID=110933 RepID=UPI003D686F61